jgi:hypothetical protein
MTDLPIAQWFVVPELTISVLKFTKRKSKMLFFLLEKLSFVGSMQRKLIKTLAFLHICPAPQRSDASKVFWFLP